MHASYTAVVRGYMLRCRSMGVDKQLRIKKQVQKISSHSSQENGRVVALTTGYHF